MIERLGSSTYSDIKGFTSGELLASCVLVLGVDFIGSCCTGRFVLPDEQLLNSTPGLREKVKGLRSSTCRSRASFAELGLNHDSCREKALDPAGLSCSESNLMHLGLAFHYPSKEPCQARSRGAFALPRSRARRPPQAARQTLALPVFPEAGPGCS